MEPSPDPEDRTLNHLELLEANHQFPGSYTIKAIGPASKEFEKRVLEITLSHLAAESDLDFSVRSTAGGRHMAITLEMTVQSAKQVHEIYSEIREVEELILLL
ncbi:MAG: hypothetical protein ABS79_02825 [Planctomycetes bacterium SCN 63-9]|nr:MAG: hypothetical protein ABS79_02825 [Planctomycetes bacterium SCN 63-9]